MDAKAKIKYVEWLSAEEMHRHLREWLSEMEFIKDEHLFFEDLVKTFTLQIIDTKKFTKYQDIIEAIKHSEKRNNTIINNINAHSKELKIMVDGINQPKEEEKYKEKYRQLIILVNEFLKDYQTLKSKLFVEIKNILKNQKQQRLLG